MLKNILLSQKFVLLLRCGSTTQKALPPQEVLLGGKNFCKGSVFFEKNK